MLIILAFLFVLAICIMWGLLTDQDSRSYAIVMFFTVILLILTCLANIVHVSGYKCINGHATYCQSTCESVANVDHCNCGNHLSANDNFCPNCGKKRTKKYCNSCGNALSKDDKYCPKCGKKIS